jgi:hypothetical protein
MFGSRKKVIALSWMLVGVLFLSPRAALRFISSLQPAAVAKDSGCGAFTRQLQRQRRGPGQPMERERPCVVRKADVRKLSADPHPADWERVIHQAVARGLDLTSPMESISEARKPLYLRLFLPATPQSHRSPPSDPSSSA